MLLPIIGRLMAVTAQVQVDNLVSDNTYDEHEGIFLDKYTR